MFEQDFQLELLTRIDTEFPLWKLQGRRDSDSVEVLKIVDPKTLLITMDMFMAVCFCVMCIYEFAMSLFVYLCMFLATIPDIPATMGFSVGVLESGYFYFERVILAEFLYFLCVNIVVRRYRYIY